MIQTKHQKPLKLHRLHLFFFTPVPFNSCSRDVVFQPQKCDNKFTILNSSMSSFRYSHLRINGICPQTTYMYIHIYRMVFNFLAEMSSQIFFQIILTATRPNHQHAFAPALKIRALLLSFRIALCVQFKFTQEKSICLTNYGLQPLTFIWHWKILHLTLKYKENVT